MVDLAKRAGFDSPPLVAPCGELIYAIFDFTVKVGITLALATKAVDTIIKPERIYCAMFGEENNLLHIHIFFGTKWILAEYLRENPMASEVFSGAQVMIS